MWRERERERRKGDGINAFTFSASSFETRVLISGSEGACRTAAEGGGAAKRAAVSVDGGYMKRGREEIRQRCPKRVGCEKGRRFFFSRAKVGESEVR